MIPIYTEMRLDNENWMMSLVSARKWNKWARASYQAVGEYWRTEVLPEHFKFSAFSKYGYQARSPLYQKKKKNKSPLYLTGAMMNMIMSEKNIKATDHGVRIMMRGPKYMGWNTGKVYEIKNKAGKVIRRVKTNPGPDKVKELTTVTPSEIEQMQKIWRNTFIDLFNTDHPKGMTVGKKA